MDWEKNILGGLTSGMPCFNNLVVLINSRYHSYLYLGFWLNFEEKKHNSFVVFPVVLPISIMLQKSFWSIRSKLLKVLPILAMILVVATILITTVVLEQVIMRMKDMVLVTMMMLMMLQMAREEVGSGAEEFLCAAADKSCLERCHYQPSPQNISIKGAIKHLLKITRNTSINKAITSEENAINVNIFSLCPVGMSWEAARGRCCHISGCEQQWSLASWWPWTNV